MMRPSFSQKTASYSRVSKTCARPISGYQERILNLSAEKKTAEAHAAMRTQLDPEFEKVQAAIQSLVEFNRTTAH